MYIHVEKCKLTSIGTHTGKFSEHIIVAMHIKTYWSVCLNTLVAVSVNIDEGQIKLIDELFVQCPRP